MKYAYRYYVLAFEDARRKRPIKPGRTTVTTEGAEVLARECPNGWVYIHIEHRGDKE